MAKIKPFHGIIYNIEKVDISRVVCPPYDVITPESQENFYNLSEHNVIRLELGKEFEGDDKKENKYHRAKKFLKDWLKKKVLIKEDLPSLYVYAQEYLSKNQELKERIGLVALVRLEEFKKRIIFPHEKTMSKPKADRLELLKTIQANLSPIFGLYQDESRAVNNSLKAALFRTLGPYLEFTDQQGVKHSLWKICDAQLIQTIQKFFENKQILLADGHHRYETALNYCQLMRKENPSPEAPWNYVMMTLVNLNENPTIYGYHRLVKTSLHPQKLLSLIKDGLDLTRLTDSRLLEKKLKEKKQSLGLHLKSQSYWLVPKKEALQSISYPHPKYLDLGSFLAGELIIKKLKERKAIEKEAIQYIDDLRQAIKLVDKGEFSFLVALNPVDIKTIWELAHNGLRLPEKTSYFYPKFWTGLVFRTLD